MDKGILIKIVYEDANSEHQKRHVSMKVGEFLEQDVSFVRIIIDGKEVAVAINRIIRIEEVDINKGLGRFKMGDEDGQNS